MKELIILLLLIPSFCISQSQEGVITENISVGQFFDEENNSSFSLTKNEGSYNLCFFNTITKSSKCLLFYEPEISMFSIFDFGLNFFESSELTFSKDLEMPQYIITITKSGNFINLKIWDRHSRSLAVTSLISKDNWKRLFGKPE